MHILKLNRFNHMTLRSKASKFIGKFVVDAADTPESDSNTIFAFVVVHFSVESLEEIKILGSLSHRVAPSVVLFR